MPSRPLFKAYTHVDPFLQIPNEQQGTAPPQAAEKPSDPYSSSELAVSVGSAVQHLFDVQLWNWTLVELGQLPACLFGAVSQNGFGCPMIETPTCKFDPHTHRWPVGCKANVSACKQSYQAHDDAGNLPWTTSMITMGQAYKFRASGPPIQRLDWVLDRVVAAIDVHVRAQGSNGGFRTPGKDGSGLWVGGPHRIPAGDPLEDGAIPAWPGHSQMCTQAWSSGSYWKSRSMLTTILRHRTSRAAKPTSRCLICPDPTCMKSALRIAPIRSWAMRKVSGRLTTLLHSWIQLSLGLKMKL